MKPFGDPKKAGAFKAYAPDVRDRLMALHETIFDVAAKTDGVGELTEKLKWGQPSYLTEETGRCNTVRIDRLKGDGGGYTDYFHCQSGLVGLPRTLPRHLRL